MPRTDAELCIRGDEEDKRLKVALVTPWDNAWVPLFKKAFEARGHEFTLLNKSGGAADVTLHGWLTPGDLPAGRNVMFLRRFELYEGLLPSVKWSRVSDLICVNSWIAEIVREQLEAHGAKARVHVIYNAASSDWTFRRRGSNKWVGMACHVHPKKNLPLAMQIMAALPADYELHIAGEIQDVCTAEYLNHIGKMLHRKVYLYGHIERDQLNLWWEQMGCCLSTSISEGNPNNVIEAMAKGIKPVVHRWPGAEDQFENTFASAPEAAEQIVSEAYDSEHYRSIVQNKFSLDNIEKVVDLCES